MIFDIFWIILYTIYMTGNILRLMFSKGLSIVRWNNFPRVIDITHMDNVGSTMHVALYLAYHEKHTFWNDIDLLFLMKYILMSSFVDLILSDIHAGTKTEIEKLDPQLYRDLIDNTHEYIYNFPGKNFLKKDIQDTLEDTWHIREKEIFLASKKYVWVLEAKPNSILFPDAYEDVMDSMEKYLEEASKKLPSIKFLLKDSDSQKYLNHVQRLCFSMRWNRYRRMTPISVMSHHVIVMYITYIIAMTEGQSDEVITDMMLRAIYHDVPEVITWDIVTPTKTAVDGFKSLLGLVEENMVWEKLLSYLSPEHRAYLSPYILDPFDSEHGKKVKYADTLSAYLEAEYEVQKSNAIFVSVSRKVRLWCEAIENPAVSQILQQVDMYFNEIKEDLIWEYQKNRSKGQLELPLIKAQA